MKKKVLAALCAGAMLCGMVSVPASAWETKYSKGDVNMDGEIDGKDVRAAMTEYLYYAVSGMDHYLTDEQIELADILPDTTTIQYADRFEGTSQDTTSKITQRDILTLLQYYTYGIVDETVREKDIVDWAKEVKPQYFEK